MDAVDFNGDSLPWSEKYRPTQLNEILAQDNIVETITRFIEAGRVPHLLFYGPPGTGKTTLIHACARRLFGENYKSAVLELNASDDRGIEVVREQIKTFASTRAFNAPFKLIILDEADSMTNAAQAALRRVIEAYTSNARFCMICNYVSKIIPALQSRCTKFRFSPLPGKEIENRIKMISTSENVSIDESGIKAMIKIANGDMRRILNIFQGAATAFKEINEDVIYAVTGNPLPSDISKIFDCLLSRDFQIGCQSETSFLNILDIKEIQALRGTSLVDILREIAALCSSVEMPSIMKIFLTGKMAEIE